jgi:hypothetical protein
MADRSDEAALSSADPDVSAEPPDALDPVIPPVADPEEGDPPDDAPPEPLLLDPPLLDWPPRDEDAALVLVDPPVWPPP